MILSLWAAWKKTSTTPGRGSGTEGAPQFNRHLRQLLTAKQPTPHQGLLCADTYNFEGALWRLRREEPQAALFLLVLRGLASVEVFGDLHKECLATYRSLSVLQKEKSNRIPLAAAEDRLRTLLPYKSDEHRHRILTALRGVAESPDYGGKDGPEESVPMVALHPAPKDPCSDPEPPTGA